MSHRIALDQRNLPNAQWRLLEENDLPALSVAQVREAERLAFAVCDSFLLMQAAGLRAAQWIIERSANLPPSPHCLVLAGPGNNGGDALLVAVALTQAGFSVQTLEITGQSPPSSDRLRAKECFDAAGLTAWTVPHGAEGQAWAAELSEWVTLHSPVWIVDGLLGIGAQKSHNGAIHAAINWVNQIKKTPGAANAKVVALDCPSGLDCDTGWTMGMAVVAQITLSFIAVKQGLLFNAGRDYSGEIWVDALGCESVLNTLPSPQLLGHPHLANQLPKRHNQHHKGSFGSLGVLAGATGMEGAALLTGRSALLLGAGRVALTLVSELEHRLPDVQTPHFRPLLDWHYPELMNKSLHENLEFASVWAAGPGMGQCHQALDALGAVLEKDCPKVLDADALNLLAKHPHLALLWKKHQHLPILTPHPTEAARLLGCSTEHINNHRVGNALALAKQFSAIVVLKGAGTVIAHPQGAVQINTTGGPMLATAGSGDVLTGVIASLLAQQLSPWHAANTGVWLHGLGANPLDTEAQAPAVVGASGLILRLQGQLNQWLAQPARSVGVRNVLPSPHRALPK